RTPEIAVLDADRVLRYRGRLDSQYRVGGVNPEAGREDLKLAIDAVLAGQPVEVAETPVDGCVISHETSAAEKTSFTFTRDVAPVLNKYCVTCHREEGGAPFSLQTYKRASAMADMMAEVVSEGRMPPWYAHPEHGEFMNDP